MKYAILLLITIMALVTLQGSGKYSRGQGVDAFKTITTLKLKR